MRLKKRDVERALSGKLECEVQEGKHRVFVVFMDGQAIAKTHTSQGTDEDLGDFLLKAMADQLGVTKILLVEVVSCTKSRAEFLAARIQ